MFKQYGHDHTVNYLEPEYLSTMCAGTQTPMARTRALLTEKEREHLASGDTEPGSRRYQVISEVRNRIQDELPHDLQVLKEHHPELYNELKQEVCDDD